MAALLLKLDKLAADEPGEPRPRRSWQMAKLDPGNQYLVDWLWGYITVGINVDKVKKALGDAADARQTPGPALQPGSTLPKLKGCGVSFLDSASEVLPIAMMYIGKAALQPGRRRLHGGRATCSEGAALCHPLLRLRSDYIDQMAGGRCAR